MHHLFIFNSLNKSIYISPFFLKFRKFVEQSVNNHTIYLFANTLHQIENTRSNVIYTIQGPVIIYTLSMAAKIMSLYSIANGKVKSRKKMMAT